MVIVVTLFVKYSTLQMLQYSVQSTGPLYLYMLPSNPSIVFNGRQKRSRSRRL